MQATAASSPSTSRRTVTSALVVDDDPFMLDFLRDMLQELGVAQVRIARGAEEAGCALDQAGGHPDMVICDLNMPGKDGFLFMEEMATRRFKGGVLVVSGMDERTLNSAALMARFHRLKIVGALAKPVQQPALAAALRQVG